MFKKYIIEDKMFTLSVCLIIKNEEDVLDRILGCVNQFADEIVIVDTGSTDASINIAKKYTNKIYHFKWIDNFSEARNFSFSKATKDYIMWLDADDYIPATEIKKILNLKNSAGTPPSMYLFKYSMGFENNIATFEFYRERLLRRDKNFQWQGFIHEVIPITSDAIKLDIKIEHRKIKASDPKRNLHIYRKAKKNNVPFTPRDTYYYARELYYHHHYKSAIKEFKKFLKFKDIYPPNEMETRIILANIYTQLKDYANAKKTILSSIKKYPPNAETCCTIANIYNLESNLPQALFWYKAALHSEKQVDGFQNLDYEEFIPNLQLSVIYYRLGDIKTAKSYHKFAKSLKPENPAILHNDQFFMES